MRYAPATLEALKLIGEKWGCVSATETIERMIGNAIAAIYEGGAKQISQVQSYSAGTLEAKAKLLLAYDKAVKGVDGYGFQKTITEETPFHSKNDPGKPVEVVEYFVCKDGKPLNPNEFEFDED